jgi:hypothetical protein
MATEKQLQRDTKLAATSLVGEEGKLYTVDTNNLLVRADGTDSLSVYVLVEGRAAGKGNTIAKAGIEKVIAGGVIPAGASFKSNASGLAVACSAADKAAGRNNGAATVANEIFSAEMGEHTAV